MNRAINRKFCVEAIEYFEDDFYYLVGQIENGIKAAVDRKDKYLLVKEYLFDNNIPSHKTLYNNENLWNKIYDEFKLREFDIFVDKREIYITWEDDFSGYGWNPNFLQFKI